MPLLGRDFDNMPRFIYLLFIILLTIHLPVLGGEIHSAAARGDLAWVQEIVNADPNQINSQDASGATALHWAVDRNQRAMVELLFALGAEVNIVHFGGMGTGLCITASNKVVFIPTKRNHHTDWTGYKTVVACGPRLVSNSCISLDPYSEGFKDVHVLGTARRTAVGVTAQGKLIFVSTCSACSLYALACIMSDLGCTDALNFDGGSSVAMHYRGKTISSPGRSLTNVLCVYENGQKTASR